MQITESREKDKNKLKIFFCIVILLGIIAIAIVKGKSKREECMEGQVTGIERIATAAKAQVRNDHPCWQELHESLAAKARTGGIEIAFFGDSITEAMNAKLMHKLIGAGAENFGISGDQTQHLLWRIQNGELSFPVAPSVLVFLIGTNNISAGHSDRDICLGVKACIEEARKQLPKTKILVLGILPRDHEADSTARLRTISCNVLIKRLCMKDVNYLDISNAMLEPDGKISPLVMDDFLHPTFYEGYERMFEAIKPELDKLRLE